MNEREKEAKARWGDAAAYREYTHKTAGYTEDAWQQAHGGLDAVIAAFAVCMKEGNTPESKKAQVLVETLKNHITENYYTCTDEILAGLGEMYVADERFKENIDKHGVGTAAFIREAIRNYCK